MNADAPADDGGGQAPERRLTAAGVEWVVRSGGSGAAGTGGRGLAPVEAVHFYLPGEARPRWEALLARGRWLDLFDDELAALLQAASPVPPLE